jgi:hypothetical protein
MRQGSAGGGHVSPEPQIPDWGELPEETRETLLRALASMLRREVAEIEQHAAREGVDDDREDHRHAQRA